jgi:hypothetical protein
MDATYDWTMSCIEDIVNKGKYVGPEPFMTKAQMIDSISRFQAAYFQASRKRIPQELLAMLRDWMVAGTELVTTNALKLPEPPAPVVNPPPPGVPMQGAPPVMAPPMAPPMAA